MNKTSEPLLSKKRSCDDDFFLDPEESKKNKHNHLVSDEMKLMVAAEQGDREQVQLLLDRGANVDARDKNGNSVLMIANLWRNIEIFQLILDHRADVNVENDFGVTPLMYAILEGHTGKVRLLLDYGVNINYRNKNGATALDQAIKEGHTEITQLLLDYGVDLSFRDELDFTPLIWAAYQGYTEIVRLLLVHGADKNVMGRHGITAPMAACHKPEVSETLILCLNDFNPLSCLEKAREYQESYLSNDNNLMYFERAVRQFNTLSIYSSDSNKKELCIKAKFELGFFYELCGHIASAIPIFESISEDFPELYQKAQSALALHAFGNIEKLDEDPCLKKALKHGINAKDTSLVTQIFNSLSGGLKMITKDDLPFIEPLLNSEHYEALLMLVDREKQSLQKEQVLRDEIERLKLLVQEKNTRNEHDKNSESKDIRLSSRNNFF